MSHGKKRVNGGIGILTSGRVNKEAGLGGVYLQGLEDPSTRQRLVKRGKSLRKKRQKGDRKATGERHGKGGVWFRGLARPAVSWEGPFRECA